MKGGVILHIAGGYVIDGQPPEDDPSEMLLQGRREAKLLAFVHGQTSIGHSSP